MIWECHKVELCLMYDIELVNCSDLCINYVVAFYFLNIHFAYHSNEDMYLFCAHTRI